jgi:uncharacterized membrane protein
MKLTKKELFLMTSPQNPLADRSAVRYLLYGIPFIIFFGTLTHFIFAWSGNTVFVGLFVPINESVWEHLKMSFWPTLVWFLLVFLFFRAKGELSASGLLLAVAAALFICPLIIVAFFYTMEGAFGIESLLVDSILFFLGIIAGQFAAVHVYRYAEPNRLWLFLAAGFILLFMAALISFTFWQPHLPLFLDKPTGTYGL